MRDIRAQRSQLTPARPAAPTLLAALLLVTFPLVAWPIPGRAQDATPPETAGPDREAPGKREDEAPINNWAELRKALTACWKIPDGTEGSTIAFRFGLSKTGALRGKPLVTARRLEGSEANRQAYERAALEALDRCFPIRVTPSFGAALGESPVRLRFVNTAPTPAYQLNSNITIFAPR
jgi:hypothetical protein